MLSAAPRASLTLPSCSPNYPRASRIGWTHARHCPFLKLPRQNEPGGILDIISKFDVVGEAATIMVAMTNNKVKKLATTIFPGKSHIYYFL